MLHTATFYHETTIDGQDVEAIFKVTAKIIYGEPAVTYGPADNWHPGSGDEVEIIEHEAINFDEKHLDRIVAEYVAERSTERKAFEFENIDFDCWIPAEAEYYFDEYDPYTNLI